MSDGWIEQIVDGVLDKHKIGKAGGPRCPTCHVVMRKVCDVQDGRLVQCDTCQRIEVV